MTAELPRITLEPLTPAERRALLRLARHSIRAALVGEESPLQVTASRALNAPGAAFVSLHCGGHLRGCIGTLHAEKPLQETVVEMARSAAFADPRFQPLDLDELSRVRIEISRLSCLVPARSEQVCPGVHGVSLTCGERRSVFLPQVATLYHWDRETLLTELCRKAMLPPQAWRWPETGLFVFTAEIFADEDPDTRPV
ncbi:MAG: AmmeMemoRadiSam system protein A [Candidatus Binatia bacterium]